MSPPCIALLAYPHVTPREDVTLGQRLIDHRCQVGEKVLQIQRGGGCSERLCGGGRCVIGASSWGCGIGVRFRGSVHATVLLVACCVLVSLQLLVGVVE